ncbi:haloacid dehalogenase-like hydrolase [Verrucomicrobiaceae bacterium N1E253]|uniref:Haloacid dehalogenase-like hydrolase n=1 Tax=Oceaniferula marina TaxID=2748318 RepID=A0A851GG82_9BACT|nr:HAD family hydrolase [Oceaniferula marina]NWK56523.1 haloacid dehalogenase-like hydrolase [Oceaniferula marina]
MTMETPDRGYALFDLDQTLIPWDTQLLFCDFILKRMPWRRFYLLIFLPFLSLHKILGSEGMKRVFLNYLWGMTPAELDQLAEEFVDQHYPDSFYPEMLEVLEQQKQQGRITVLSSASPEIWVKPIAKRLGFDFYFGTTLETAPRVRLFPDIIGGNNKSENKIVKMRSILPEGFAPEAGTPLPDSHGFSDSHVDLPMLNICESASMVHPTDKLRAAGEPRGWKTYTPERPTTGKREFAFACIRQALGIYHQR